MSWGGGSGGRGVWHGPTHDTLGGGTQVPSTGKGRREGGQNEEGQPRVINGVDGGRG